MTVNTPSFDRRLGEHRCVCAEREFLPLQHGSLGDLRCPNGVYFLQVLQRHQVSEGWSSRVHDSGVQDGVGLRGWAGHKYVSLAALLSLSLP